ncbi:MAG TPA: hypothetical protein VGM12_15990, partial [Trebonia sp.]
AIGSTAAGFILDAFGPRWGYAFAAASGVTAALIYLAGLRRVAAGKDLRAAEAEADAAGAGATETAAPVLAGGPAPAAAGGQQDNATGQAG